MSLTIEQLPKEPIIIAKFTEPFDPAKDTTAISVRLQEELNKTKGNVYYVADMSAVKIKFSDLVMGLAQAFADKSSPYANPRLRTFTVGSDELIAFGTKAAAEQAQYGKANVSLYSSLESALAEVRKAIAQG